MNATSAHLKELIKEQALVYGTFTFSSGKQANSYVDLRRITLHHQGGPLAGKVMLDLFEASGLTSFSAVGGLTMGADPLATAIMHVAAQQQRNIDAFVVRKNVKTHGLALNIEGPNVKGRQVIALDDTSTTGNSITQAIETLKSAGAHVLAAAVLVDRNSGAQAKVEQLGIPYLYAYSIDDLELE